LIQKESSEPFDWKRTIFLFLMFLSLKVAKTRRIYKTKQKIKFLNVGVVMNKINHFNLVKILTAIKLTLEQFLLQILYIFNKKFELPGPKSTVA
jgi:hypothetical protein